jgi:hypothetical protein
VSRAQRRTLGGDESAEARVAGDLAQLVVMTRGLLGDALEALLLMGSFARGEGGLIAHAGQLSPYNDYDLVAIVRGPPRRFRELLTALSWVCSRSMGVEVDLHPMSIEEVDRVPRTLFWLDVSLGGVEVLHGDATIAARLRRHAPRAIPLDECGRLLANRAMGIALSNLERDDRDHRRARHLHKAVLACGDSYLLAADRYAPTLAARLQALEQLEGSPHVGAPLVAAYRDALAFRGRPDHWRPREPLDAWSRRLRAQIARWHLRFEAFRAGTPEAPLAFACSPGALYRELPDVGVGRSALSSLRGALRGALPLFPWVGHVRERLARVAVALAYGHDDRACRARATALLGLPAQVGDDLLHHKLEEIARFAG